MPAGGIHEIAGLRFQAGKIDQRHNGSRKRIIRIPQPHEIVILPERGDADGKRGLAAGRQLERFGRRQGDNRSGSEDSRFSNVGNVKFRQIKGKVWLRIQPVSRFGLISSR